MRLALLADIHGNLPALEAVLVKLKQASPDAILIAGDWISGPCTNECCRALKEHMATSIVGNSDIRLLEYLDDKAPESWKTLKQFALARWDARRLDQESKDMLHTLPIQRVVHFNGSNPIRIVHGSLEDPFESLFSNRRTERLDRTFVNLQESVLVCGHTHFPMIVEREDKQIVNPGSVAAPLNGDTHAQYALMNWKNNRWQISLERTPYNHDKLINLYEETGMREECGALGRAFFETMLTGDDIAHEFFTYARKIANKRGIDPGFTFPDDIWEEADQTFDWHSVEKRRHN